MHKTSTLLITLFLTLLGIGIGLSNYMGVGICLLSILIIVKADKQWKHNDTVYDSEQEIKHRYLLSTQNMLDVHCCETSSGTIYNPAIGLQVSD